MKLNKRLMKEYRENPNKVREIFEIAKHTDMNREEVKRAILFEKDLSRKTACALGGALICGIGIFPMMEIFESYFPSVDHLSFLIPLGVTSMYGVGFIYALGRASKFDDNYQQKRNEYLSSNNLETRAQNTQ